MPTFALVVMLSIAFLALYAALVATICVVRDRSLPGLTAGLRLLVSWCVPLLGPILTIRVAAEESPQSLPRQWWLWPLRPLLSEASVNVDYADLTHAL
jgi:hypothetical protein